MSVQSLLQGLLARACQSRSVRTKRPVVNDGEVEVRVEAIGLNFRDVLNVPKLHSMH